MPQAVSDVVTSLGCLRDERYLDLKRFFDIIYILLTVTAAHLRTFYFALINSIRICIHVIMAALCNRAGHYIFALWFLLSSFFFSRLISAVGDWMCTILLHMVWH